MHPPSLLWTLYFAIYDGSLRDAITSCPFPRVFEAIHKTLIIRFELLMTNIA